MPSKIETAAKTAAAKAVGELAAKVAYEAASGDWRRIRGVFSSTTLWAIGGGIAMQVLSQIGLDGETMATAATVALGGVVGVERVKKGDLCFGLGAGK